MRATTWFFLLLTAGLIFAGAAAVLRDSDETPDVAFQNVQKEIARGHLSVEEILEDLEDALSFAERSGDGATATEIRRTRGRVFLDLGAHDEARRDFETVLDVVGRDYEVEGLLVELEKRAGNLESAIARVERRLEDDPSEGDVWVQAADVYVRSGDRRVEDCLTSLARVLVSADEVRAGELLRRGAALDPTDPLRVAVGHSLWQLFASDSENLRQEALGTMDAASEDFQRARRAYAHSLELRPTPGAVGGLLDLLSRAQRDEVTLDLGIASLPYDAVREDPATALILIRTLRESGQLAFAAELATTWAFVDEDVYYAPLYAECCITLLENESWGPLINAANRLGLTSDPRLVPHSNLYRGLALANREDYHRAGEFLTKWLDDGISDPFPNATTKAWRSLARCWEELDRPELERLALEQAVASGADFDGATWLHLAELQSQARHGGYRTPEERWARGMAELGPVTDERADELFQRWREMGDKELETTAFDPSAEHRNMVRTETWNPRPGLSAYELFRLAEEHEEAVDLERALVTHRRLLEQIPGFPPSVDRSIELALQLGYEKEAAELLLERMERTGRDEYALEVIDELDLDVLGQDDLVLLMRLDPEITGRRELAESYVADDRFERAVAVLGDLKDPELDPDLRWYGIDLLTRLGRYEDVVDLLDGIDDDELSEPRHLGTLVDAYVGAHRDARVQGVVEAMLRTRQPNKPVWLHAAEHLLDGGYVDEATRLVDQLDASPATTGGGVLVRGAIAALLRGDVDLARRKTTRAQAFPTRGLGELMHLVTLVEHEGYHELRAAVSHLRLAQYPTTPYQDLALLLLEDDLPRAREAVEYELERAPRDPKWMLLAAVQRARDGAPVGSPAYFGPEADRETELLLHGTADPGAEATRDERRLAALLLALDDPVASIWARGALLELDPRGEHLWPTYLAHASRTDLRHRADVRRAMRSLTERFPQFAPAWDHLDELLLEEERSESIERLELRAARRKALGDEALSPVELELDKAREAWIEKQPRRAAQCAQAAAALAPDSLDAHRVVAGIYAMSGNFDVAVEAYDEALRLAEGGSDLPLVADAVEAYERAQAQGALGADELRERLEELAGRFPDDPVVARARAKLELVSDMRNPALGVARAYGHLDRFREDHPNRALEDLRAGSSVAWGRFLLEFDPDRAARFTREELLKKPGSLDLWIFMGDILKSSGDLKAALKHMHTVHRMAPREGRALRALAELEALNGVGRAFISRRVQQVRDVEKLKDTDPQLSYWRAMAIMGVGQRGIVGSLDLLGRVWKHRLELPSYLALERVGLRYSAALIARGQAEDRMLAREVLAEFQDGMSDPYARELAGALFGLALHDARPSE